MDESKLQHRSLGKNSPAKHGVKIEGSVAETLQKHYNVKPKSTEVFIMPASTIFSAADQ